ncbi:aminotransferase class I/II-fold pyridoxal phosphate-dependent enzyme [Kushneria phyllosphaerae]|uniref:aminotransferase class I/II-fold pyridoxal phosphate-dependent enzyme n=1 Tax=Kushneria phyllosphaerae TaxID=2100822 RepID=UPI000D5551A9|nr:aminotransferase class I/II-fold pyridoxal phosphate-dependent enzyme [Kushneria phyllosphaerae]
MPSRANFLFVRPTRHEATNVAAQLRAAGILVRHFGMPGLSDWLRISIGTEAEMTALTAALAAMNETS